MLADAKREDLEKCKGLFSKPNDDHKVQGTGEAFVAARSAGLGRVSINMRHTRLTHAVLGFSAEIEPHGLGMRAFRRTVCHSPLPGAHHCSN